MGYAALLIVLFHFYIPVFNNVAETFIYRSAYIGVDLFFFVSASSLSIKSQIDYYTLDYEADPVYLDDNTILHH